jgi:hypothetical protein
MRQLGYLAGTLIWIAAFVKSMFLLAGARRFVRYGSKCPEIRDWMWASNR